MTDPNLPTMRTRINGLALTLAEKTWAQEKLDAHPNLASTWTPETDVDLIAFIKQSATQSAPPGPLWGSTGLSGSSSHSGGPGCRFSCGHEMTDPNLPTMRTRINGLALTLAEKTWAQDKLTANPDLATTWTPETDVNLTAFIKQSATQSAPPGSSSRIRGREGFLAGHVTRKLTQSSYYVYVGFSSCSSVLGGISEEKFEELMRITKAAYEEATQSRRERLQKSVSGKQRDNLSQLNWKNKLIQYYQRADLNNPGNITCMMLNQSFPGHKVIAAHLWDRSTNGLDPPHDFGLPIDTIDSERNGILVAKGIEDAWTYDRIAFIYNSLATPPVYFMVVLDPTLLEELVEPSPNIKFKDMDGQPLHMPLGIEPPFRRLMNFKSRNAELMRISKAAYEEATQSRRERLQKSVSGKRRDNLSQKDWKNKLIQYYQRADLNNPGNITCMMLNQSFPGNKVIAAHLWDRSTNGLNLPHDFGLPIDSIDSERNGILVAKGIEDAWTYDRVAFIYNSLATPPVYFMVVLDPTLLEELVEPSPNIKFKDMDRQPLHVPLGVEPPFRRLMNFKSRNAVNDALHLWPEYWTDPSRRNRLNFDDFWKLSDKASAYCIKLRFCCIFLKIYPSGPLSSKANDLTKQQQSKQYKIVPYSGLRNSAYEKELNAGHTNRAAVLRGMKIQHLPKGIREYVNRDPADFEDYFDEISAETKYLSTISRLVKKQNGPDARNRIRRRILQAAENSGDQLILGVLKRYCSPEESVDSYTMRLWSQFDPIVPNVAYKPCLLATTFHNCITVIRYFSAVQETFVNKVRFLVDKSG
ncbi:hypothetical protein PROFUN_13324 [Planoprotostelium fungivorum]|uniref:HNH nuclease domain-containing protein n=1 Tax=Planoprotostelium fungivorum TaxID=1890364 RepID=A0A2P6N473_9EUKA|nr:hypothetical protein PROFUN_13324 [Planoprotostelium fungivorum]